ncbi:MAG: type I restriction enzyme HsdR N-terminal domain-containing protein, partial [Candidatus Margulisbacteria bacterium]|nr:type I restriction enzyme HsdR N-terminal domain-containing protein [Candidatus Margulisiibacteriota bacterium]
MAKKRSKYNEADTRAKLIDPHLKKCGWDEAYISREYIITKGKIIVAGNEISRGPHKKADYLLLYNSGLPIAVVEAKDESHEPDDGIQQAKEYAELLELKFAFSTNGHGIEEFDFIANQQTSLKKFPTPEELYRRLHPMALVAQNDPLILPFYSDTKRFPRYYQLLAANKVIEEIAKG